MPKNVSKFIDDRGGPTAFAEKVSRSPNNVCVWRCRNRIPRAAWPEIIEAFPDISMAQLKAMESVA